MYQDINVNPICIRFNKNTKATKRMYGTPLSTTRMMMLPTIRKMHWRVQAGFDLRGGGRRRKHCQRGGGRK